jgi:hypothetical protein
MRSDTNPHGEQADRYEVRTEEIDRLVLRQLELLAEIDELRARLEITDERLAKARAEKKALAQYDPLRMKKNLDASKKKLMKKQQENEHLRQKLSQSQQKLSDSMKVNARLMQRLARMAAALRREEPSNGALQQP